MTNKSEEQIEIPIPSKHHQGELARNKTLLLATCAGVICSSIVLPFYSIGALVVPVTEEFGWTRAEFQLALLFSTGAGVITAPIVGWLIDRYGSRNIALPGLLGLSVAFVLAANMNGELWMLYLCYAAMALLGAGTIPVTWTRAITTNFFEQRGHMLGAMERLAAGQIGGKVLVVPDPGEEMR